MADLSIERLFFLGKIGKNSYDICRKAGLLTLSGIYEYSKTHDFSDIPGCGGQGKKSLQALCYMYEKGVLEGVEECDGRENSNEAVSHEEQKTVVLSGDMTLDALLAHKKISVRAYNCCRSAGLLTLTQIVDFGHDPTRFCELRNSGRKTVRELDELCTEYKNSNESGFKQEALPDTVEELSAAAMSFFEAEFVRLRNALSVRGRHLCDSVWTSFGDVLSYMDYTPVQFSKKFGGKKKSSEELYYMLYQFKEFYRQNKDRSDRELEMSQLERLFPFLSDKDLKYVDAFRLEYGRCPMLYILRSYFAATTERRDLLYAYRFGILTGTYRKSGDVGDAYQISSERVRQLVQGYKLDGSMSFMTYNDWGFYIANAPVVLTKHSSFYKDVSSSEDIKEGYDAFAGLLGAAVGYRKIRKNGERIYLRGDMEKKAKQIFASLEKVLSERYAHDVAIPLVDIVGCHPMSQEIAKVFLKEVFEVEIGLDDILEIKHGKIDVAGVVIEILSTAGCPLYLHEIYGLFKERYPDYKYEDASHLHRYIIASQEIVSLGKSGQYALKEWNLFTGCIKDCAYMILKKVREPMPDDELVEKVLRYFPDSNYRSIMSTLVADPKERFVHYTDSSVWLAEKGHLTDKVRIRPKIGYDDRLEDLKNFLITNGRWPFASGGDEESSLTRWIYNHTHENVLPGYSEEEAIQIKELQKEYSYYPHNVPEYDFWNMCTDFKNFVRKNSRLPEMASSRKKEKELATWFDKMLRKREPYEDNRRLYFADLLSCLETGGFVFKNSYLWK
jgi:hypothetical protein